jgi:hypothetical protein
MQEPTASQFESIEGAREYVRDLLTVVEETRGIIQEELSENGAAERSRHCDALRLVDYKLVLLDKHLRDSSRLLNDLRTLRRALYGEREPAASFSPALASE